MEEISLQGIAASNGIAIGPAYCFVSANLSIPVRPCGSAEQEMARFGPALERARRELQELHDSLAQRTGEKEAAIFEAHQMMLEDPTLAQKVREAVDAGQIIEQAVLTATNSLAAMLEAMADPLFAARAADVKDVGARILRSPAWTAGPYLEQSEEALHCHCPRPDSLGYRQFGSEDDPRILH